MGEAAQVIEFKLPKKPKVVEKEPLPDQRKVAVLPIKALTDKAVTDGMFRTLALLCSYCNRAGITWVSQAKLAKDAGTSRQAISKQLIKLQATGYIEVIKKGFRGERNNTLRVIFDDSIKTEDAIAITSSVEDTRPPAIIKEQAKKATTPLAADGLPDLSAEQIEANKQRIKALLAGLATSTTKTNHKEFTMPKDTDTETVKAIKKRLRKPSHTQPNTVAYEEGIHTQPHTQLNEVAQNTEEHSIERYIEVLSSRFLDVKCNLEAVEVLAGCMSVKEAAEALEAVAGRYQAEGLNLPNLMVAIEDMMIMQAERHLEPSQRAS